MSAFRVYAADECGRDGYAATYLGEDLTRGEVDARLAELLDLERAA